MPHGVCLALTVVLGHGLLFGAARAAPAQAFRPRCCPAMALHDESDGRRAGDAGR